jgi:GntR family transcriptional regulator
VAVDEEGVGGWSATVAQQDTSGFRLTSRQYLDFIMDREWNDSQPIYRQLHDRVVAMILDGVLNEGDPLPSVRTVAVEYRVNPLTVLKAYQQLVDEQLVEKRRGRGMFVMTGARLVLLQGERKKFLSEDWPKIYATIQRLGFEAAELLRTAPRAADTIAAGGSASASGSQEG